MAGALAGRPLLEKKRGKKHALPCGSPLNGWRYPCSFFQRFFIRFISGVTVTGAPGHWFFFS